jgi:hypothetical protein
MHDKVEMNAEAEAAGREQPPVIACLWPDHVGEDDSHNYVFTSFVTKRAG